LHRQQIEPQGLQVVDQVSQVYTKSYGDWSKWVFVVGAFCTLFSTLVVIAAASGRMWADLFASLDLLNARNPLAVRRCHQIVQTVWLVGLLAAFLMIRKQPETLVIAGHFVLGAVMTPLLMFAICWLAFFRTDRRVRMSAVTAIALLASALIMLTCVGANLVIQFWP
jgi:hypothetical protein